jgi:NADH dehydrogenase FAD-containing subunit
MTEKHVVVLGAGFAGLNAVRTLARQPGLRVTLVDRNNYHLFQPLLYQVASAGLEAPQITFPIRAYLRKYRKAGFLMGNAEGVDPAKKLLWVEGKPLPYDYLLVGTGTRTADFGLKGVEQHGFGLKDLDDAMRIRDRVLSACEEAMRTVDPERRKALLTFVIVGGGPTGVELAGALGEIRRHIIPRDYPTSVHPNAAHGGVYSNAAHGGVYPNAAHGGVYPDANNGSAYPNANNGGAYPNANNGGAYPNANNGISQSDVRIVLVETGNRILDAFSESSARYAEGFLKQLGVEIWFGERVIEITPLEVKLQSGKVIPTFSAVWTAGVTGVVPDGLPTVKGNRVATAPGLYLNEHPSIYVAGDLNFLEWKDGRGHPQVAPTAIQQGSFAAQNILRELRGQEKLAFKYKDKGSMATLGRAHAVTELGNLRFKGFPAWSAWLAVHLYYLIGFRNRAMVLGNWAYSYFTYDRAVRVMHQRHFFAGGEALAKPVAEG